jgi:hypothetical protein
MNDTIEVAILVSVVSPAILVVLTTIIRRYEKKEDYRREDAVAAKAAIAAALLVASNKKIAEKVEQATVSTNSKLDVIHVLVNSNMTAAMQQELDATVREHAGLLEIVDLKRKLGQEPTKVVLGTIEATSTKIAELQANLKDRLRATEIAGRR